MDKRFGWSQSRSGRCGEISMAPTEYRNTIHQLSNTYPVILPITNVVVPFGMSRYICVWLQFLRFNSLRRNWGHVPPEISSLVTAEERGCYRVLPPWLSALSVVSSSKVDDLTYCLSSYSALPWRSWNGNDAHPAHRVAGHSYSDTHFVILPLPCVPLARFLFHLEVRSNIIKW